MNVRERPQSPDELEDTADRLRRQIRATLGQLRVNVAPRNLAHEIVGRAGFSDASPRDVFDAVAKRHPLTSILLMLGMGAFAFSALRSRGKIGNTIGALGQPVRTAFQRRAAAKREEFVRAADTQISAGAERFMNAAEAAIGQRVSQLSLSNAGGSVIESAVQMLFFAALEAMIMKVRG